MFSQSYTIVNNSSSDSQQNFVIPELVAWAKFSLDSFTPWFRAWSSVDCNGLCNFKFTDLASYNWFWTINTLSNKCSQCKFYVFRWWSLKYTIYYDKMPVSELSPVINWLESSINEFIPYVVYVWLWLLSAVIWFFAIKWLLRFVKWSTLSVFKSRKRK